MKKFIFLAIAALAVVAGQTQEKQTKPPPPPPKVNLDKFVPPPPPPKPNQSSKVQPTHIKSNNSHDYQAFLNRNPTVKRIGWTENTVRIYLKSGKEESYQLKDNKEMQTLKNKYGELPIAPPLPPKPKVEKFPPPVIKAE
jgi:hypothetical protein